MSVLHSHCNWLVSNYCVDVFVTVTVVVVVIVVVVVL